MTVYFAWWYPLRLIIHQYRYRPSDSNENIDINFSAHGAFLG